MPLAKQPYRVYQQRTVTPNPRERGDFCANLAEVGTVDAYTATQAIRLAADWPAFRGGRALGRFPVALDRHADWP